MLEVTFTKCSLRDLRLKAGYTQEQLAKLAGITRASTISDYERMVEIMSHKRLIIFSHILNCSINDIYDYTVIDTRL